MISQIRRAALSVHLNIAEGASRKSETERKGFYEVSRGSVIEIAAALDIANGLHYLDEFKLDALNECTVKTFNTKRNDLENECCNAIIKNKQKLSWNL